MAHLDQLPAITTVAGIAEPHQSTVASIQRAVRLGLFSESEAELMINRIRALATMDTAEVLAVSPNRTDT